ncbi:MAG: tRNA (guanosine(37)-N1)-methyltransferase TrmD [Candidatus Paraimprobicoccus trichonymphae]|uniref:tRNA (guanine-N(1)-)-methyltransferase n=1 Tax=Candidatus Paraimprobicoccus trichonymphae TaxID=3033793 RepID=A0AA48I6C6_9FIRM|nr:MAG: tRNA (guanosine(37)-N1)-methyltransferase TrmD [Candidatus Paraimprobicoccus trichonymphae]
MTVDIITLFPEIIEFVISRSVTGRAIKKKFLDIEYHQLREFTDDRHKRVDGKPYGGGKGMLLKAEPIFKCFEFICNCRKIIPKLIYMSPKGKVLTQQKAKELTNNSNICILCGHYEGIDERIITSIVNEQISIGEYVLTGGEIPALVLLDTMFRLVPGVLSDNECFEDESFYNGKTLEYPQYTRPYNWRENKVPDVLLSGNHKEIKNWKTKNSDYDSE